MLKRILNLIFNRFGYVLERIRKPSEKAQAKPKKASGEKKAPTAPAPTAPPLANRTAEGFVLYRYLKPDGSFDYDRYRQVQDAGNKRKINNCWVIEDNIAFLSDYVKGVIGPPKFGICHGTRRGKEQEWFSKHAGCDVIGTEISETAVSFPNTIEWDFHEVKAEWIESVDFIYSNSFDHSYDPDRCLNAWVSCLRKGGLCILEHSTIHEPSAANELDPFGADFVQMPYLIAKWGKGKFGIRQLLEAPTKGTGVNELHFIVIQKF